MLLDPAACLVCGEHSRHRHPFKWRGYYRFECPNGHRWGLATPKQAAANWARLSSREDAQPTASAESS